MFNNEELKLTYQELVEIEGYENIIENEATEIAEIALLLSIMAYNAYKNREEKNTINHE